uniref:Uncharacterized protein n=1 Tax=Arundo donax TaxID=35708 RepID=A0A0A9C6P6_ARUDO
MLYFPQKKKLYAKLLAYLTSTK